MGFAWDKAAETVENAYKANMLFQISMVKGLWDKDLRGAIHIHGRFHSKSTCDFQHKKLTLLMCERGAGRIERSALIGIRIFLII